MKKLWFLPLLMLAYFTFLPSHTADPPKGKQTRILDTVKDRHSKLTAKYVSGTGHTCTAILISSTAAITAQHCGGTKYKSPAGTIYPGASGMWRPFGYMNVRFYIPHPRLDIAVLKGIPRDQDKYYKAYIKPFATTVKGYTTEAINGFKDKEAYSYGYPYKGADFYQYRSDGTLGSYSSTLTLLDTTIPAYPGQSGSGVFLKDGQFIGILISTVTTKHEGNALPFTQEVAKWINDHAK